MLALEILNKYRNLCSGIYLGDDYSDGVDSYSKDIEECDNAIAELKALENRSCDSCKHSSEHYRYQCLICEIGVSNYKDSSESIVDYDFYCNSWESKC